jgi:hypothetical protein
MDFRVALAHCAHQAHHLMVQQLVVHVEFLAAVLVLLVLIHAHYVCLAYLLVVMDQHALLATLPQLLINVLRVAVVAMSFIILPASTTAQKSARA